MSRVTKQQIVSCSRCRGAGDVWNNAGWSKCRTCDGSGVSPASVDCPYCGATAGTGCYRHGAYMQGQADYFHKRRVATAAQLVRRDGWDLGHRGAVTGNRYHWYRGSSPICGSDASPSLAYFRTRTLPDVTRFPVCKRCRAAIAKEQL